MDWYAFRANEIKRNQFRMKRLINRNKHAIEGRLKYPRMCVYSVVITPRLPVEPVYHTNHKEIGFLSNQSHASGKQPLHALTAAYYAYMYVADREICIVIE
jgi:hypothetical protein